MAHAAVAQPWRVGRGSVAHTPFRADNQHRSCPRRQCLPPTASSSTSDGCSRAQHSSSSPPPSRRAAVAAALLAAATAPAATLAESLGDGAAAPLAAAPAAEVEGDTTVTARAYLDIGLCPEGVRTTDRTLGDKTVLCTQPEPLGRLVLELYGKAAPGSVATFLAALQAGSYTGSAVDKIWPGRYIVAGAQGSVRMGKVRAPPGLAPNPDVLSSSAFRLRHRYGGTLSLNLSENEDDEAARFSSDYRNVSFMITTGPAPAPYLDDENIVFGRVTEGLDVLAAVAAVPTFYPADSLRAYNDFAKMIGDDRANKTRSKWGQPLKAVVFLGGGVL